MIAIPFVLLIFVGLAIFVIRRSAGKPAARATRGQSVRRFFQYALMLAMLVVFASGLVGLLSRLFSSDTIYASPQELARSLAFVVVGGPAYVLLVLWARRTLHLDPTERASSGWAFYVSAASLISLLSLIGPLSELLQWSVGLVPWQGAQLAAALVWLASWATHLAVSNATLPVERALPHRLIGSLAGLIIAMIGLSTTLGAAFNAIFGLRGSFINTGNDAILRGVSWSVIGITFWVVYWLRTAVRLERDQLWFAYVLLVGVAGGLITAISAGSVVLYDTLVWVLGEPRVMDFAGHFDALGISLATALVGILVWWYHQSLIERTLQRTEVRRIYEYVMAAGGLGAMAIGVAMLIVAFIESVSRSAVFAGGSAINSLLLAVTLLLVGAPVWLLYWSRIQRAEITTEQASPTRRIYLFVLFGVGAVAAVVGLIMAVYSLFTDVVEGMVSSGTLREMRFSLAVVLTTGAISGYHWAVYRKERHVQVREDRIHSILVIGGFDQEQERALEHLTRARVTVLAPLDGQRMWTAEQVMAVLPDRAAREVVVVGEESGLRVIPVERISH